MKNTIIESKMRSIVVPVLLAAVILMITHGPVSAQDLPVKGAGTPHPGKPQWSESAPLTLYMKQGYGADETIISTMGNMLDNDSDVSVCLYIGKAKNYDPRDVMGLKRSGQSWKQVIKTLSVDASKLFMDVGVYDIFGVPARFKHAFGEYAKWRQNPAYEMDLSDEEVRDMVQLNFVVKNFGVPPVNVMRLRNSGKDWTGIILSNGR